ncbi:hypothetical protein C1645_818178 [Glomus cerebriforme]|uniref:Uncharacterized protein n=1 Tax=Glomus cerebriforme TaxID=658196 RepID=A0A397T7Y2_9GLOM|nr:hypothetical protein C1645_818178 [Glomus cerebriforme]
MMEEELKFTTIYPLFNAIMDLLLVKDTWGEVQSLGSKDMRNEKSNPFVKTHIERKVDMKGILIRTFNKFEALYGEVANSLYSLGISLAKIFRQSQTCRSDLSLYAIDWTGNGMYHFGLIKSCLFPSNKENCALFESVFCFLKELEKKLTEMEKLIQELHVADTYGKYRQVTTKNNPTLNLNRTPN